MRPNIRGFCFIKFSAAVTVIKLMTWLSQTAEDMWDWSWRFCVPAGSHHASVLSVVWRWNRFHLSPCAVPQRSNLTTSLCTRNQSRGHQAPKLADLFQLLLNQQADSLWLCVVCHGTKSLGFWTGGQTKWDFWGRLLQWCEAVQACVSLLTDVTWNEWFILEIIGRFIDDNRSW